MKLSKIDIDVVKDKRMLEDYAHDRITLRMARQDIERRNECVFESDEHFEKWAKSLGYKKEKRIREILY